MPESEQLFTRNPSVDSRRILYTPSPFARSNLVWLQEVGSLRALARHTSRREGLQSFLCFLVTDGAGELSWEGMSYALTKGDVVFLDCRRGYAHSTGAPEQPLWSLQWCHFFGPAMEAIYAKYCERGGRPVIHNAEEAAYRRIFEELYSIASSDDYIRDMRINEKLSALLTLLMESSWNRENRVVVPRKIDIRHIKDHLDQHYQEKITLESVADCFFVDKHYLARRFKEQYGMTLTAYLNQQRITRAKWMLRFTEKSVEQIALECGVGELSYFSRLFKKLEGVSPTEFRNLW